MSPTPFFRPRIFCVPAVYALKFPGMLNAWSAVEVSDVVQKAGQDRLFDMTGFSSCATWDMEMQQVKWRQASPDDASPNV